MLNKIHILLIMGLVMALAISLLVFWKTRRKEERKPFCVTYHVAQHTISCHEIIITYNDSNRIVQETLKDRSWSKKVCLPPNGIATLSADELIGVSNYLPFDMLEPDPKYKEFEIKPVSIWIEHEKKVVLTAGYSHLRVSLLPSEVN